MDIVQKKRKSGTAGDAQAIPKKQKVRSQPRKPVKKARHTVGIDSLQWTTSKLPDMLNDAEGFYGLEEVDDVEIVRNADNTLQFVRSSHD